MNLQTVIDNINRTIRGKMKLMDSLGCEHPFNEFIIVNIGELERIRNDLELCRDQKEIKS